MPLLWLSKELHAALIDAVKARVSQPLPSTRSYVEMMARVSQPLPIADTVPEDDAPLIELPDTVRRAAVAFSFGDPQQIGRNEDYARRALARGEHEGDVVRALQDGEEL